MSVWLSRRVAMASLGLRLRAHGRLDAESGDEVLVGDPVEGLEVLVARGPGREQARYRATTGIYGFVRLGDGDYRLHLRDPRARFLPRALTLSVSGRDADLALAQSGVVTPLRQRVVDAGLLVSPAATTPPGFTSVFGQLRRGGDAMAWARIEIAGPRGSVLGMSDARGDYQIWLRDERRQPAVLRDVDGDGVDEVTMWTTRFERRLRIWRMRRPVDDRADPLFALDDALLRRRSDPDFGALYQLVHDDALAIDVGQRARFDLT